MMTNAAPTYFLQTWPTARQWDRAPLTSPLTVTAGSTVYHGWCVDVGPGGIGFTCAAPLQPGDEIRAKLVVDSGGELHVRGIVRHSANFRSGCEFLSISPGEQQMIERYIRSARSSGRRSKS